MFCLSVCVYRLKETKLNSEVDGWLKEWQKPSPDIVKETQKYQKEKKKKNLWGICTVIYTSQKNDINNQETSGLGIQM